MPEPLQILYLDHTARLGGGEIALLHLLDGLDRTRFTPVVALASDGPLAARLRAANVETHVLPLAADVVETRKDTLGLRSVLRLRQVLACAGYVFRLAAWARRHRIDLIHTNSLKADLYGGLAARLARIPVLWHVRDGIHADYLPTSIVRLFRLLVRRIPYGVIANSHSTLAHLALPQTARAWVVHDGCPIPPAVPACPAGDPPIITLVGRIAPWKGQHVFLQAASRVRKQFPQARFWIVGAPLFGEEEYARSLPILAAHLDLTDHVTFWGFREDVPDLLAQTTILVHASTLGEPFGQVVIEGMAAGKPVIATDGGAIPEIVVPGETGLLVPCGDAATMAQAIEALLADPARAAAMGASGRRRVEQHFTTRHTAGRIMVVYAQLLRVGETPAARRRRPLRSSWPIPHSRKP